MTETTPALDDQPFLDALMSLLVPPEGELPAAGDLGLAGAIAAGIRGDPVLGPMVQAGVETIRQAALTEDPRGLAGMSPEAGTKLLESQLAKAPFVVIGILRYLYPAYYQHPSVLAGIGVPARPPFPEGYSVEPTDPALLEKLRLRRLRSRQPGEHGLPERR